MYGGPSWGGQLPVSPSSTHNPRRAGGDSSGRVPARPVINRGAVSYCEIRGVIEKRLASLLGHTSGGATKKYVLRGRDQSPAT